MASKAPKKTVLEAVERDVVLGVMRALVNHAPLDPQDKARLLADLDALDGEPEAVEGEVKP